ncbi:MAG: 4Fe-4S binding protein [Planctomycetota bacterium]|jgi:polyferredoxin/formate hydrogenlyase subunit 6/NADH:ubiquinone oxidoreductase subunit I
MKIVTVRRISQVFFFVLFLWFCIVSSVGEKFWQIRDWPVNLILWLDPLVSIGTVLTTHTLYWVLLWSVVTIVLTIIFGRVFCSWICPFGSIHHFVGYLSNRKKPASKKIELNKYRKAQCIKYFILVAFLAMAAFPSLSASLQTGLLDPIPLVTRSFNLVIVPIFDQFTNFISVPSRFYEGAWLVLTIFLAAVLMNMLIPRFYCRFICPLGALFGVINRFAIWRIGQNENECIQCRLCEKSCEGGCEPRGNMRISECVLCFNCLDDCNHGVISYQTMQSTAGEITGPDISRRGFALSLASGLTGIWAIRLAGKVGENWFNKVIRPPGSLKEKEFLKRCITAGFEGGLENLWTPVFNNRIGSSGCQLNCVSCGQVCPTSAIRPITLDEKLGQGKFIDVGPIKMGTAFFDRNRCLPWAMDRPCIVCEENCPVSPKAIFTREEFITVREQHYTLLQINANVFVISEGEISAGKFDTGDYYLLYQNKRYKIVRAQSKTIEVQIPEMTAMGEIVKSAPLEIQVRLQRPYVDIEKCIGCGVCEHECPVSGKKAIRISAEGETRSLDRSLLLSG